ncbi:MAG: hypothetical protein NZ914_15060, partial [Gemmatales bacterium]|nr:hypothetical protein [Gemmatales bacterium]
RFVGPFANLVAQTQYSYTSDYLSAITHLDSQGAILEQLLYQFNDLGLITQITSTFTGSVHYTYADYDQPISEASSFRNQTFSYDGNGNRTGDGYVVGP